MVDKGFVDELELMAWNLEPYPFNILTWLGGTKWAIGQTKKHLHLIFQMGSEPTDSHFSFKCAITSDTNYDILIGQQTLYLFGFGLDNWIEEGWIQLGWSSGDGRKEMVLVTLAHWMCLWQSELCLVVPQLWFIFLLEQPQWRNIFLWLGNRKWSWKYTSSMLVDSTSKGSIFALGTLKLLSWQC